MRDQSDAPALPHQFWQDRRDSRPARAGFQARHALLLHHRRLIHFLFLPWVTNAHLPSSYKNEEMSGYYQLPSPPGKGRYKATIMNKPFAFWRVLIAENNEVSFTIELMTDKLFWRDGHLSNFTARVVDCFREGGQVVVVLDQTAFYPEGGGQPSDIGFINRVQVMKVEEAGDGRI